MHLASRALLPQGKVYVLPWLPPDLLQSPWKQEAPDLGRVLRSTVHGRNALGPQRPGFTCPSSPSIHRPEARRVCSPSKGIWGAVGHRTLGPR